MHDWDQHQYVSDGATERVRKHREKQRRNVSVTPPDTEQIQTRTETDSDRDSEPETARAEVRPIRQERSITPGGISPATWEAFQSRYAESGKPLNEADWIKAGMEAATLDLSELDMTERVIPSLTAELPGWAEREIGMVPFPAGFLKSQPWTRKAAKPREPPLTKEQRRQHEIDRQW